jgi:hypothetical protein
LKIDNISNFETWKMTTKGMFTSLFHILQHKFV